MTVFRSLWGCLCHWKRDTHRIRACPSLTCLELALYGRAVSRDRVLPIALSPAPTIAPGTELELDAYFMNKFYVTIS